MKSLSMPLNIEHSLEHVSTPSASSEDYVLPPDLPRETMNKIQRGRWSTPILEGTFKCTALQTPLFSSLLTQSPLKIMMSTKDPVFFGFFDQKRQEKRKFYKFSSEFVKKYKWLEILSLKDPLFRCTIPLLTQSPLSSDFFITECPF